MTDRNHATGGGVTAGLDFALRLAAVWGGDAAEQLIELIVEYAPEPYFNTGLPEFADQATPSAAREIISGEFSAAAADRSAKQITWSSSGKAGIPA